MAWSRITLRLLSGIKRLRIKVNLMVNMDLDTFISSETEFRRIAYSRTNGLTLLRLKAVKMGETARNHRKTDDEGTDCRSTTVVSRIQAEQLAL